MHLSRLGDDVDFLMKTFGVTMVKVHQTIKKDDPKLGEAESSKIIQKDLSES